ncbi:DUF3010 family protein [Shewanella sp. KX20019]|uniref:DUF3010 family protein n=1 Tax=Shewanella sp. KX20019 TaxID=2803864 RepID=UPI0019260CA3|nr:DUF3010 family protein [Shewanella sp. KX20019]QQX79450.1 DUF3010 family protein [Shewanella sp. KX20019]
MIVAGLFLKANEVRVVTLTGDRASHSLIAPKVTKFSLHKNPTQADVVAFIAKVSNHLSDFSVEKLVLNRRATTGQGAGGAGTFLMEGAILASCSCEIEFIHPATLRASDKKHSELKNCRPKTVDLAKAYDLAFECLG